MIGNSTVPATIVEVKMRVGQTVNLTANSFPTGATYPDPAWASLDALVATVAPVVPGNVAVVTAVGVGSAYITATVNGRVVQTLIEVFPVGPDYVIVSAGKPS